MNHIVTNAGDKFLVDDDTYAFLHNLTWSTHRDGPRKYALSNFRTGGGVRRTIRLHRIVTSAPRGMVVDHINGDTQDNRRENLRICTQTENLSHRVRLPKHNKTGVIGVDWNVKLKKWKARINHNNKYVYLGLYANFDDAVAARKAAEKLYFGDFATNAGN